MFGKLTLMIDLKRIPKTEFASAVAQIAGERGINLEKVIAAVEEAILAAYKRDCREHNLEIDETAEYSVKLNPESGETKIFLAEDGKTKDVTPPGFGRIAAQTAKMLIVQKIREAEKEAIISQFRDRVGTLVTGVILRVEPTKIFVGIGKAEAVMPREERIFREHYYSSQRLPFYLKEIRKEEDRETIIVSRAAPQLVVELFKREVPEVSSGAVEIKLIARRPGERTKIAVNSSQPGVDPVGSCVGQKGVRVQAVIKEINNEKIDVIPFSQEIKQLLVSSLAPAESGEVAEIDQEKKTVTILVDERQLAMAIGEGGENVNLAGTLTGFTIKVGAKKEPEEQKEGKEEKEGKEKEDRMKGLEDDKKTKKARSEKQEVKKKETKKKSKKETKKEKKGE